MDVRLAGLAVDDVHYHAEFIYGVHRGSDIHSSVSANPCADASANEVLYIGDDVHGHTC